MTAPTDPASECWANVNLERWGHDPDAHTFVMLANGPWASCECGKEGQPKRLCSVCDIDGVPDRTFRLMNGGSEARVVGPLCEQCLADFRRFMHIANWRAACASPAHEWELAGAYWRCLWCGRLENRAGDEEPEPGGSDRYFQG